MTGRGINTVRIGDEVKHITELDALTLMHEWSKLTKENADLYDYNRQVNRKRAARTVLTGMCYSVGSATRQGSSSLTRFIGQSAMTSRT